MRQRVWPLWTSHSKSISASVESSKSNDFLSTKSFLSVVNRFRLSKVDLPFRLLAGSIVQKWHSDAVLKQWLPVSCQFNLWRFVSSFNRSVAKLFDTFLDWISYVVGILGITWNCSAAIFSPVEWHNLQEICVVWDQTLVLQCSDLPAFNPRTNI